MDEKAIVISKDQFDIKCHADGLVEITAGDKKLLQLTKEDFDSIVDDRMRLIYHSMNNLWGQNKK